MPGATPKADRNPVRVHVLSQLVLRAVDLEDRAVLVLDRDRKRQLEVLGFLEQGVLRSDEIGADGVALAGDVMDLAADLLTLVANAGRVIGEHPLRAAQVGDAHRRQQHPAQFFGGKRDRHAEDAAKDAVLAEDVPERLALAEQAHARPCPAGSDTGRSGSTGGAAGSRPS